jgi:adenylosuccinate lyase
MIERYSREEMAQIFTREERFRLWLEVELAVCEGQVAVGFMPQKVYDEMMETVKDFPTPQDMEAIDEEEEKTKHEIVAFLNVLFERTGETASRYIHYGMTSSDVMDTATALQVKKANVIIERELNQLLSVLKRLVKKYKYTPIIGRSHGMHAEPTTFGLKLAVFYSELKRSLHRFHLAAAEIETGKCSGAVGNYTQIEPQVEEIMCSKLGLSQPFATNQIIQRDRYAFYFSVLAIIAGSIEKLAVELRNLARTEIGEVEEPFSTKQKGSSALPHKRNPVSLEQVSGLCRLIRSYALPAMENQVLWHERDISHSSVERVILPDSLIALDYVLDRMTDIVDNMNVFPDKMKENINMTKGLVFSQRLMLRLINTGMPRSKAHTMIQGKILTALKDGKDFHDTIKKDGEIRKFITIEEIESLFDLDLYTRQVNYILRRVFADESED